MARRHLAVWFGVLGWLLAAPVAWGQARYNGSGSPPAPTYPYPATPRPVTPTRPATPAPGNGTAASGTGVVVVPGYYGVYPYYYGGYPATGGYPVYTGPVVAPTESLYGPGPIQRMMGVDGLMGNTSGGGVVTSRGRAASDLSGGGSSKDSTDNRPDPTITAQRAMGVGDSYFRREKYLDALERYQKAAEATPESADPFFRRAFALLALGKYDRAAGAAQRGLELNPSWPSTGFPLSQLYGEGSQAAAMKHAQLEKLAATAEASPNDARLWFLIGFFLASDGQRERALPFFQQARKLAPEAAYLKPYLDRP